MAFSTIPTTDSNIMNELQLAATNLLIHQLFKEDRTDLLSHLFPINEQHRVGINEAKEALIEGAQLKKVATALLKKVGGILDQVRVINE